MANEFDLLDELLSKIKPKDKVEGTSLSALKRKPYNNTTSNVKGVSYVKTQKKFLMLKLKRNGKHT